MSGSRSGALCAVALATVLGATSVSADTGAQAASRPLFDTGIEFDFADPERTFDEVRQLILQRYYTDTVDEAALYWGAIHGMLRRISPPKTPRQARIWTAAEYQRVLDGLRGQQTSAGIQSRYNPADGSLTVTGVSRDSPADGVLQLHDRIMRIDGNALSGLAASHIDRLLNSPESGSVMLTVVRDIEVLELRMTPATHDVDVLESGLLPDGVAYLRVLRMTAGIAAAVRRQLQSWQTEGVQRLVIDLRNNTGGVFLEGLRLAELFVPAGTVLVHIASEGKPAQRFVSSNDAPSTMQVMLLTNERTASAAEIMVAALVSAGRAPMIGTRTFGKATMEQTFKLANDMRVRFIVGAMYAPNGQSWHERGLRPQVAVDGDASAVRAWHALPLERRLDKDAQLRSAWQILVKG